MNRFLENLKLVADRVNSEKGLHFFALVHPTEGLHDRWDLLVSSPGLEPWSMTALKYIAGLLQEFLQANDIVRVSRIVVLPRNNEVINSILNDEQIQAGRSTPAYEDQFDRAFVMHPAHSGRRPVLLTGSRQH